MNTCIVCSVLVFAVLILTFSRIVRAVYRKCSNPCEPSSCFCRGERFSIVLVEPRDDKNGSGIV